MKRLFPFLILLLMIAAVLFWRQVWGLFAGMTVLEAMGTIVQFILHVTVATLAGYAVTMLPEYVAPWLKAFRWEQRTARRARRHGQEAAPVMKAPRMNFNPLLMALLAKQAHPTPRPPQIKKRFGEGAVEEPTLRLDL